MNKYKHLIIIILILGLVQVSFTEKRKNPKSMKALTDPSSPSYVPIPYPKTREEIMTDLKYAFSKTHAPLEGTYSDESQAPPSQKVVMNLLEDKPIYKIDIIKVKNRNANIPFDYEWLINVINKDNTVAARIVMTAEGLWGGTATPATERSKQLITENHVIGELSNSLGKAVTKKDIKRIKRIAFYSSHIATSFHPAWEFELKDGSVYYYSSSKKEILRIKDKIPWEKDEKGRRPDWQQLVFHWEIFAFDSIDDKIIVFERVKKQK
ncbi:MAG: hypothetical protein GTN53_09730 [Candidatus Aminicenantes bacterium]|nr:hypothetical protein [Candidatus Aminicenantes bacterium]NIQ67089.1 hypothetical protein [Candidatus Aminicenantes bacterium]NIT22771.1 hypothetical protein [Candidatus Aminicenantes bacterium]